MRVLHILNHIQKVGNGIVNVAVDLACLQAQAGYEVSVISGGGEYEALLDQYQVTHFRLNQTRTWRNLMHAASQYRTIVRQVKPDIVHAHMMTGAVLARGLKLWSKYGLVATVHNEFQESAKFMGLADRVIAVSQAVSKSMQQRGIPTRKLRVVTNGTLESPRVGALTECSPAYLQRPAITTVAGMNSRKGISELIAAFERVASDFPEAHLYLVGHGPEKEQFQSQARQTRVAHRIHFEGFQSDPRAYLLSTDVFVLASHREPFGLAISEAREVGCAIVASHVDGIPEVLEHGKAGLLVPPGDSQALATTIADLLKHSTKLNYWKEQAQKNLDWLNATRVATETLGVYGELKPN
ncbi:glycosyltransferase family 4 protein [Leptothoe sp. LEGE 181152]|uniref:Glycosyltransferase n=1 Tax=Adonisia turfae CCMR0081 TaxID=2292702 RepID=A0A6M0RUT0_9CYAN|nr:glycosyltransferase family 4 protein [Adonisia turfae]MDV3347907.1 glycosyltransferase family 4 protein [Leptothoe sp. LEGE 181152]NEZ60025.1 glycosyltransferase [Adonisia turfae CCMR0081]